MRNGVVLALGLFGALVLAGCSTASSVVSIGDEGLAQVPDAMPGVYMIDGDGDEQVVVMERDGSTTLSVTIYEPLDDEKREEIGAMKDEEDDALAFLELIGEDFLETVVFADDAGVEHEFVGGLSFDVRFLEEGGRYFGEVGYDESVADTLDDLASPMGFRASYFYVLFEAVEGEGWDTYVLSTDDLPEDEYDEDSDTLVLRKDELRSMLRREAREYDESFDVRLKRVPFTVVRKGTLKDGPGNPGDGNGA